MSEEQPTGNVVPAELYGLFAGMIDQAAVQRFHNAISIASQNNVKMIHVLFQSTGGLIGDGISLYNLFRASPVPLTLYNAGGVQSVAVIAYLGAQHRKTSKYGAFMTHRAYLNPTGATSDRMTAAAPQLAMEDERVEAILKLHAPNIPKERWDQHKYADVRFSAAEATEYGIAGEFGEYSPPPETRIFNVWPPQS